MVIYVGVSTHVRQSRKLNDKYSVNACIPGVHFDSLIVYCGFLSFVTLFLDSTPVGGDDYK